MVITILSKSLSLFYYFMDILDRVYILLDTDQRRYYDSLAMFSPFLHSLGIIVLHHYPRRTLMIDGCTFHNTLH